MHTFSYLSVGVLALTANSFLIPGDLKDFSTEGSDLAQILAGEKRVSVDCSSCPYALNSERDGRHEWTNDVASDLEMKLDSNGDSLRLNGNSFYPINVLAPPPPLHVSQIPKENKDTSPEGFQGDLKMSYSLEFDEKKAEDGSSLVTVVMTILGLDGEMVKIDSVEVRAIKDPSGKLILVSAVPVPFDPNTPDAKCGNMVCRVITKIATGINKAKTSAKNVGHRVKCFCVKCFQRLVALAKAKAHQAQDVSHLPDDTVKLPTHHKFRPGMAGGDSQSDHAHHHNDFFHRMVHVVWGVMKMAFVPILIGVAFGMAASALGMLVGQLVIFLWMRYRKDEHVVYEPVYTDEKDGLPVYTDVPTAQAVSEKEVEANA